MNESAGTVERIWPDAGPMERWILAATPRPAAFEILLQKAREADARERTLTAERDRLADALRWGVMLVAAWDGAPDQETVETLRLGIADFLEDADAALTDIPDCPHAQRVEALEKALKLAEAFACRCQHHIKRGFRECAYHKRLSQISALTASTGEA